MVWTETVCNAWRVRLMGGIVHHSDLRWWTGGMWRWKSALWCALNSAMAIDDEHASMLGRQMWCDGSRWRRSMIKDFLVDVGACRIMDVVCMPWWALGAAVMRRQCVLRRDWSRDVTNLMHLHGGRLFMRAGGGVSGDAARGGVMCT